MLQICQGGRVPMTRTRTRPDWGKKTALKPWETAWSRTGQSHALLCTCALGHVHGHQTERSQDLRGSLHKCCSAVGWGRGGACLAVMSLFFPVYCSCVFILKLLWGNNETQGFSAHTLHSPALNLSFWQSCWCSMAQNGFEAKLSIKSTFNQLNVRQEHAHVYAASVCFFVYGPHISHMCRWERYCSDESPTHSVQIRTTAHVTLPDGHMVVADVPLPVYTEGRGLGVEAEEADEDLSSRRLGRLSEATFGQLAKCISRSENNPGCCCCCCCCALILLAGFPPSCWLLHRKDWLGMHHRRCHPKTWKSFILPPLFTLKFGCFRCGLLTWTDLRWIDLRFIYCWGFIVSKWI